MRHFERAVQSASMKTYSAWILSRGRAAYLSRTAWSMAYLPVCWLRGSAPMRTVARVAGSRAERRGAAGEGEGDGELHLVMPARGAG